MTKETQYVCRHCKESFYRLPSRVHVAEPFCSKSCEARWRAADARRRHEADIDATVAIYETMLARLQELLGEQGLRYTRRGEQILAVRPLEV